jgi:glycine/D-amino acid oxidase-like deaminating enzyme
VVNHWQGLRARPLGRPAPLLEQLEPGLLLASGHYRNGVLLAPASAAWVAEHIATGDAPERH